MEHRVFDALAASQEGSIPLSAPAPFSSGPLFDRLGLPSLLVVESDEEAGELLQQFLSREYDVMIVRRHNRVAELLRHHRFDMVLMEVNAESEQEALALLQQLRAYPLGAATPVIASLDGVNVEVERRVALAGFDAYIKRTFTVNRLCAVLGRVRRKQALV
jgi:DNA-binding response OmpR family regulator